MYALLLVGAQVAAAAPPVPSPPPTCDGPAFAQFDFWVGDWDVYPNAKDPAKAPLVAHSRIERLYAGCAIRENWMPLKGPGGGSLNNVDPRRAAGTRCGLARNPGGSSSTAAAPGWRWCSRGGGKG